MLIRTACCCLGVLLAATGCQVTDPLYREGLWRPNRSNDTNLLRMVANPSDLAQGVGDGTGDGQQAVAALDRRRADKVKKLPNSGLAQIVIQSTGSSGAGGQ